MGIKWEKYWLLSKCGSWEKNEANRQPGGVDGGTGMDVHKNCEKVKSKTKNGDGRGAFWSYSFYVCSDTRTIHQF